MTNNQEVKPEIGMKFLCEEDAHTFYQNYANKLGFKVIKRKIVRLQDKTLRKRNFVCSCGLPLKKQASTITKYTRTGCNAKLQFTFEDGKCLISQFISEHNHKLGPLRNHIEEADSLIQPEHDIETKNGARANDMTAKDGLVEYDDSKSIFMEKVLNLITKVVEKSLEIAEQYEDIALKNVAKMRQSFKRYGKTAKSNKQLVLSLMFSLLQYFKLSKYESIKNR